MQKVLSLESKKYSIKLENFEGPLDLLCTLIEKNKMSVYDIKLDEITEQYLEHINKMEEMNLEVTSEFVVMASTLLYMKSKRLLPSQKNDEEDEITEEELIRRIIEYKKYKDITANLQKQFSTYSTRLCRMQEELPLPKQKISEEHNKTVIPNIYLQLLETNKQKINKNAKNIEKIAIVENYTVASKLKDMFRELIRKKSFVFNKLFSSSKHNKNEIVTAFSGLLELSRRNKVVTTQEELFGDINVEKAAKR